MTRPPVRLALLPLTIVLGAALPAAPAAHAADPAPAQAPAVAAPAAGAGIAWQPYAPAAFRRALADDRLILLVLEAPWSPESNRAEKEVFAAPEVVEVVRAGFVAVRERADLRPELTRRYPAEGWPAVSILLPDGSPLHVTAKNALGEDETRRLTSGYRDAPAMAQFLARAREYYRTSPNDAVALARKREEEIEKSAVPQRGKAEEAAVWSIARELRQTFDPERRYFGGAPRLPRFELIELMYVLAPDNDDFRVIAGAALDTLAAKLADPEDGALRRLALGLDWENPQPEKLLDRNARYLDLLTLAFRESGSRAHRERALRVAAFIAGPLSRPDGFFATAIAPGFDAARDVPLSGQNGVAAASLIRAGAALGDPKILERGLVAARALRDKRYRKGRLVPRAVVNGESPGPASLDDQAQVAWAFLAAYEATGLEEWLDAARDLARTTIANLRAPAIGALQDAIPQPNAPRPLRTPLYPLAANAEMVRVLVRLHYLHYPHPRPEDRVFVHTAREILNAFAGSYARNPLFLPHYALAAGEYFLPPLTAAVAGQKGQEGTDPLRIAALGAAFPFVIVRTFNDQQLATQIGVPFGPVPTVSGFHCDQRTDPVSDPAAVRGVFAALREAHVRAKAAEPGGAGQAPAANPAPAGAKPPAAPAGASATVPKR